MEINKQTHLPVQKLSQKGAERSQCGAISAKKLDLKCVPGSIFLKLGGRKAILPTFLFLQKYNKFIRLISCRDEDWKKSCFFIIILIIICFLIQLLFLLSEQVFGYSSTCWCLNFSEVEIPSGPAVSASQITTRGTAKLGLEMGKYFFAWGQS